MLKNSQTYVAPFQFLIVFSKRVREWVSYKQIDVIDDDLIVLYKLSYTANSIHHGRMRIAGSNGYERPASKHSEPRDAEYSASNLYEKSCTFISVMAGLSMHTNAPKHLMHGRKLAPKKIQRSKRKLGKHRSPSRDVRAWVHLQALGSLNISSFWSHETQDQLSHFQKNFP